MGESDMATAPGEKTGANPHRLLARLRRNRHADLAYRIVVGFLGVAIIVIGLALLPLPGPGWLVIFLGLALLATEFSWAERLLHWVRERVEAWTDWVKARSWPVRLLLGAAGLAVLVGLVALYVWWQGVPGWVPLV